MKKALKIITISLSVYALLLVLLVFAESSIPDSNIHSFKDALWFSLSAMTTVSFTDAVPISSVGRTISLAFSVLSITLIALLIIGGIKYYSSSLYPRIVLSLGQKKKWFVFSDDDANSTALANDIAATDPNSLFIFINHRGEKPGNNNFLYYSVNPWKLIELRHEEIDRLCFFMISENEEVNYDMALPLAEKGIDTYCLTDLDYVQCPQHLHLVSRLECIGRGYWKQHPLQKSEKIVVLLGCYAVGREILERALLTNVFEPSRTTEYHVFGSEGRFAALHPEIIKELSDDRADEDKLIFHSENWESNRKDLLQADRIIVCFDEKEKNVQICEELLKWYPLRATIHLYSTTKFPYVISFGDNKEIMTKEIVVNESMNRAAEILNDIYNQHVSSPCPWVDLNPFLKQSNLSAADHLPIKIRILLNDETAGLTAENCRKAYEIYIGDELNRDLYQEIEHRRWLRFHKLNNWEYAETRDNFLRRHPDLVPYGDLPAEEQEKNSYSWEMLLPFSKMI